MTRSAWWSNARDAGRILHAHADSGNVEAAARALRAQLTPHATVLARAAARAVSLGRIAQGTQLGCSRNSTASFEFGGLPRPSVGAAT